jgi:hypothetical protein
MQVAFYKAPGHIADKMIRWWTRGEYSHVEIISGIDTVTGEYLCSSATGRDKGVRTKLMPLPADKWDIIEVPQWDGYEAYSWFIDHHGKAYDYIGDAGFVAPLKDGKDKWFCSEAVAESVGLSEPWRITPIMLARICEYVGGTWVQKTSAK